MPAALVLLAAVLLPGAATAYHLNPTCAGGGFTLVWDTPTVLAGANTFSDECILVRANITVAPFSSASFDDVQMVFANNETNVTVTLDAGSTWQMADSALEVWSLSNTTAGFFFNASAGSNVYLNDTTIVGGGVDGNGLTWQSGMYFDGLNDFAWNRVQHTTFANGLLLVNYTNPLTVEAYTVVGGFYGLYLRNVGNATFENFTAASNIGALINDSANLTFTGFASTAPTSSMLVHRVQGLALVDAASTSHSTVGFELDEVTDAQLLRLRATPPLARNAAEGLRLIAVRNVSLASSVISNHRTADFHILALSQDVNVSNLSLSGGNQGRGLWVEEAGSSDAPNRFSFDRVNISGKGTGVELGGAARVRFESTSISSIVGRGFEVLDSADVRFANGSIQLTGGGGAYLRGGNLTVEGTAISGNAVAGVEVGDSSFLINRVDFSGNDQSVRSNGPVQIVGPSAITNSTLPALTLDAVNITAVSGSPTSRLTVTNNTFTNTNLFPRAALYALRLEGFSRVEATGNTFQSLPLAFFTTNTLVLAGNVHRLALLPAGAVVVLFDNGTSLDVSNETFVPGPAALGTAIRAPYLGLAAVLRDLGLPRADYGVWVTGVPGAFLPASVEARNLTVEARRDAVYVSAIGRVDVDGLVVHQSTNAVVAVGAGSGQQLSVRNATLQANGTGVSFSADALALVTASDIAFNATGALPATGVSVSGGANVTLARIALDRVLVGITVTDARRIYLTQVNFTNNAVGFSMTAPTVTSSQLNWTVDTPTVLRSTWLRLSGEVTVRGVPFTVDNATVAVFATTSDARATRFFFEGASALSVTNGSNLSTIAANTALRLASTHFTLELSPLALVTLSSTPARPVLIEGLGDPARGDATGRGLVLRAADLSVAHVRFVNVIRPLQAIGVNLTVLDSSFESGPGNAVAVMVSGPGWARLSRVSVRDIDGVSAIAATVWVDNSTFTSSGVAVGLYNAQGDLNDSSVSFSSNVVLADFSSSATVCRVDARFVTTAFVALNGSSVTVTCRSTLAGAILDARASLGGSVDFEGVSVDRTANGHQDYSVDSNLSGSFSARWTFRVGVCVLSDGSYVAGADVSIVERQGELVFVGPTRAGGFTDDVNFVEFESRDGTRIEHSPATFNATYGRLSNVGPVAITNATQYVLCVDDVPPVVTIFEPIVNNTTTSANTTTLTYSAFDEDSGLAPGFPCVSFNGGECRYYGESNSLARTLVVGENIWQVVAVDLFGNRVEVFRHVSRDITPPVVVSCDPPSSYKTSEASVELTCLLSGGPVAAVFGGVNASGVYIDANGTLFATIPLTKRGVNTFSVFINDSLGLIRRHDFAWTLDLDPPTVALNEVNRTLAQTVFVVSGRASNDTVLVTFNNVSVPLRGADFSVVWNLSEGRNDATLVLVDDVGNVATVSIYLNVDTTTNCVLYSPDNNEATERNHILVSGRCDPDVRITVTGVPSEIVPSPDGTWSVDVILREGDNRILVEGFVNRSSLWHAEVHVYYRPTTGSGDMSILLLFGLLAAGTLAAAFFISRRRKVEEEEEALAPARPATGSQKAPPRPKPPTLRLPETPPDLTFRPKPPQPPSPPR